MPEMQVEPRILRIELPPDIPTLNANDRPKMIHKRRTNQRYPDTAKKVEALRSAAYREAKAQPFMPFARCRIRCIFRAPNNRRRDVANLYPSFKACIDGLVDAGVMRDDHDGIVREVSLVRGENLPKTRYGQLILQVIECD